MKKTKKVTLTAMLMALSVALLTLGSLLQVLDLSIAAIISAFVVFFRIELGTPYAIAFWLGTSFLSLLIYPGSTAGMLFALLGLYPLLKSYLERLPHMLEWGLKVLLCEVILIGYILIARFVFLLPDAVLKGWLSLLLLLLGTVTFLLYDVALSKLILFYSFRIRPRIAKHLK